MASTQKERKLKTLAPTGITKWTKGMMIAGTISEIRESAGSKFQGKAFLLDLVTDNGKVTYGCPTILHNYLRQVDVGEYVKITCLGKIRVPNGKAWDFSVEVEDTSVDSEDDDKEN